MSEKPQNQRIDTPPDAARQAVLEAAYEQQKDTETPYKDVEIKTYGELLWVFEQRQWSGEFVSGQPNGISKGNQHPNLSGANLQRANLSEATLREANLSGANLQRANLSEATLWEANLSEATLREANLSGASLGSANLSGAYLVEANLSGADLSYANLSEANLGGANLSGVDLREADLSGANLQRANLSGAVLEGADLTKAKLNGTILDSTTVLGDVIWDGVNLSQLNWEPVQRLGDDDIKYPGDTARAYRQVATQLRSQGMNEVADRFAYLAQLWQRRIMRQRLRWNNLRSLGPYLGSLLLWAISGYGYRPSRTFVAYLLTVGSFAGAYFAVTHTVETQLAKLSWDEALVLSLTSFHGRGFLPGFLALGDWVARIGALEAVIGLFIELILIATFSRRFLGN